MKDGEAGVVVFGVPCGFDTSNCPPEIRDFLQGFYVPHTTGTEIQVIRRNDNSMHYVFLVYETNSDVCFVDVNGRSGSFFGIDVMFKNRYLPNTEKLEKLFDLTYERYVKNQIIQESPNGLRKHMFSRFGSEDNRIANHVSNGMNKLVKEHPELNIFQDVRPLPPLQNNRQRV